MNSEQTTNLNIYQGHNVQDRARKRAAAGQPIKRFDAANSKMDEVIRTNKFVIGTFIDDSGGITSEH